MIEYLQENIFTDFVGNLDVGFNIKQYIVGTMPCDLANKIILFRNIIKSQLKINIPTELIKIIYKYSNHYVPSDLFIGKHYTDAIEKLML